MSEKLGSRAGQYRFTMYVPECDEDMMKDYIELCRARGATASQEILDFVKSQMPNQLRSGPQTLDCQFCHKEVEEIYLVRWASGRRMRACVECFKEREAKGLVRQIIKRPEVPKAVV